MAVATVGDYELAYDDEGSGFPILLIHGLAGDRSAWVPQRAAWKDRHRVVSFDNRGAGASTQKDEPISTEDLARDTLELLNTLDIESAHIVGRSMGGAVAQHLALMAPERVHTLTMCASFGKLDPVGTRILTNMREVLEWRRSWADHASHSAAYFVSPEFYNDNPDTVNAVVNLIAGETRMIECYSHQNIACIEHDTLDRLGEITCPTQILAGGMDGICSLTGTRWMQERLPQAKTVIFERSSHFFLMEEAPKFMEVMGDWLATHTP